MEDFLKIKKMLSKLGSADLELLIIECVRLLRKKSAEETLDAIRMARKLTPEDIEKLKK